MTSPANFLEALHASPADDLAWLAYADWLEERGDGRCDFVRRLVAFGRGEVAPPDDLPGKKWLAWLRELPGPWKDDLLALRACLPVRFRIVKVFLYGKPPV